MILADKIIDERKKNGWSQEELADKLGVSRQAVSKWESATSTPDLQRIIQLAELFEVSTDYLLKDEIEAVEVTGNVSTGIVYGKKLKKVSMEEANSFLDMKKKGATVVANATLMCIISPAFLIGLATMAEDGVLMVSESLAAGLGLIFLFGMIAAAVFMFITYGMRESRMEHLEKGCFETEYGVTGMVKEKKKAFEPVFTRGIAIGVVTCIISVVPLVIVGLMEAPDYVCGLFVVLLLVLIACGVNVIIRVAVINSSYDALLQEGEYSEEEKKVQKKLDGISGAYWCLATAIYLGWSFLTNDWNITWVVWPVAGVLYAAVSSITHAFVRNENN